MQSTLQKKEERKQFFFEKKNQKTFANLGPALTQAGPEVVKVFCFFFQKSSA